MKIQPIILVAALLAALPALPALAGVDCFCCYGGGVDVDGDGWGAECDNCILVFNPSQTDSDYDGCGNACDADFNQDGVVAIGDFSALAGSLNGPPPPPGSMDIAPDPPDGVIAIGDFSALAGQLNGPPGPSGTTSGLTACP
jgi:hypothetical protein